MNVYPTIWAQETNQTNKQSNLTLTVSCVKGKMEKVKRKKWKQNKTKKEKKMEIGNNSKSGYVEKKQNKQ